MTASFESFCLPLGSWLWSSSPSRPARLLILLHLNATRGPQLHRQAQHPGIPANPSLRPHPPPDRAASPGSGSSATAIASKKTLLASEQDRPDIKAAREEWTTTRQPRMRLEPHRLVFLDETGTTTKMTRLRGRCPNGQRLRCKAPFGHWMTQTFVASLRCDKLTALFVVNADKGDVVILDNLAAHKSKAAEKAIKARGAWILFLPPIALTSIRSKWPSQSLTVC